MVDFFGRNLPKNLPPELKKIGRFTNLPRRFEKSRGRLVDFFGRYIYYNLCEKQLKINFIYNIHIQLTN